MASALEQVDLRDWALAERDMAPHITTLTEYASHAHKIVEFGVRGGVSTWALLDGLPESGLMWSVDINECTVPPRVSRDPRWTFILGDDTDQALQDVLPTLVDLVFIDTSHEYEHTVAELDIAQAMEPDRIICHDADWPGVDQAITEFCRDTNWAVVRFDEAHDDGGGFSLAVLEQR